MNQVTPLRAVPSPVRPVPDAGLPLVLVIEPQPGLSLALGELCDFLRIRVGTVSGAADLREALAAQPIAVLVRVPVGPVDVGVGRALQAVARHDAAIPVLLVTDAPDTGDDAPAPSLSNLHWMAGPPGLKPLVEFLFLAERRDGVAGLVPL